MPQVIRLDAVSLAGIAAGPTTNALTGAVDETAPATDTASSGLNGRLQRIAQRLTSLIALMPTSIGQKAKAAALAVTLSTDEDLLAINGAVTEAAPASDTASSGLNGRLQRIAQRLTSLIALHPASLGKKLPSTSFSVTEAGYEYETIAASATDQVMGATGATGDYIERLIIQPVTTAAGTVVLKDNATTIFTFTTGTLSDLKPIIVPLNLYSVSGAWKVTTGANVTAIAIGDFL